MYEFTLPDKVGLVIAGLIPLVLYKLEWPKWVNWLAPFLIIAPIIIFPAVNYLRLNFSSMWLLIYGSLALTGCLALIESRIKYFSILSLIVIWFLPFNFFENQKLYYDRLVSSYITRQGIVDIVSWRGDKWVYYNESLLISTADGHILSEVLAHTTLPNYQNPDVLLLGGDHGFTAKEIEKHEVNITHIPFDNEFAKMDTPSIHTFLKENKKQYNAIIIDLPDPDNVSIAQFYSREFYKTIKEILKENGLMITNAGSSHSYEKVNLKIKNEIKGTGLEIQEFETHIPTLGQRSWIIGGYKIPDFNKIEISVSTKWINKEAISMMLSKGEPEYPFKN